MSTTATRRKKKAKGDGDDGNSILVLDTTPEVQKGADIDVPLDRIIIDDKSDRLDELLDPAKIDELAGSMARFGLQHPVQVVATEDEKYRLVFGRRRVMAARRLGWTEIPGRLVTFSTEDALLSAREVENVQRQDLNPIEEAIAVSNLLDLVVHTFPEGIPSGDAATMQKFDDLGPELKKRCITHVAQRIGKSETWVRDRAFLASLSGKTRDLVVKCRLPLSHAREISKVADPTKRDELAEEFAHEDDRGTAGDLDDLRRRIRPLLFSLGQVPWRLDVPFAGGPACTLCPHNSANNPGLFEHAKGMVADLKDLKRAEHNRNTRDGKEPEAGVCLRVSCFQAKVADSNKAIGRIAGNIARKLKETPKKERAGARRQLFDRPLPEFIPKATIEKQVEVKLKPAPKSGASKRSSYSVYAPRPKTAKEIGADAWKEAREERAAKAQPAILKALAAIPGAVGLFKAMEHTSLYCAAIDRGYNRSAKKQETTAKSPAFRSLLACLKKPDVAGLKRLGKDLHKQDLPFNDHAGPGDLALILDVLAEVLDVEVEPAPKLADFIKQAEADKKAAKSGKVLVERDPADDVGDDQDGDE